MNRIDRILREGSSVSDGYARSLQDAITAQGNHRVTIEDHPVSGRVTSIIYLTTDGRSNGTVRFSMEGGRPSFSDHRGYFASQEGKRDLESWVRKVWR